jgi:hypothetical protein
MNYQYIPQKVTEKYPVYDACQVCSTCGSTNSYPMLNMVGSPRMCRDCGANFKPQIDHYKEKEVEQMPNYDNNPMALSNDDICKIYREKGIDDNCWKR